MVGSECFTRLSLRGSIFINIHMTLSHNWLSTYLPEPIEPEKLSKILTAVGLEVEQLEKRETIPGGLGGLVVGEVLTCENHPDAEKLKITTVSVGDKEHLQIVCGASNIAAGQKVAVATIGTIIYPINGEPMTMKKAKIRGVESHGMICAEDEIGLSVDHDGILVLPDTLTPGTPLANYLKPETDYIFEIGLTPNRMDAMSHLGVARDVHAYLVHHDKKSDAYKNPLQGSGNTFKIDDPKGLQIEVVLENETACQRYSALSIIGITVAESPDWLKNRLRSIGLRPINNIVDITNFILHETGQPLHAFDIAKIAGNQVRVKTLEEGTIFQSLDEKERKLSVEDLMICDGEHQPMCIGGVFGGLNSGVSEKTTDIFLESAWFSPTSIRKSSVRHGLRTDAATRFEKGVDISQTVVVLKRAAMLIKELAGGKITGTVVDMYPNPKPKTEISLKYHYLKKLSGKNYHPDAVRKILGALGFEFIKEGADDLWFAVPYHKPDVTLPADLVEEIMRIDGLDNIEIPEFIKVSPSADLLGGEEKWQETVCNYLTGLGFQEIFTNSITNSQYYNEAEQETAVKMQNNLSAELDILRPSMLETGLEAVAHNLNRRNRNLQLFEIGKTYQQLAVGKYAEPRQLSLLVTGTVKTAGWQQKDKVADFFYLKGAVERLLQLMHVKNGSLEAFHTQNINGVVYKVKGKVIAELGEVSAARLKRFDIKQPVWFANCYWDNLLPLALGHPITYREIPKYPSVERDLALVVDQSVSWQQMEEATEKATINSLQGVRLFDIYESDKLGIGKKSMALNFIFQDSEKTMTEADIDRAMSKLTTVFEKEFNAAIRK